MKLRKDLVLRTIGDDHIIVDPEQDVVDISKVFSLNESATWVWSELQKVADFTQESMARILIDRYEVDQDQAMADAQQLIEIFDTHNMLE